MKLVENAGLDYSTTPADLMGVLNGALKAEPGFTCASKRKAAMHLAFWAAALASDIIHGNDVLAEGYEGLSLRSLLRAAEDFESVREEEPVSA
jgi:hypothetical protein